MQDSMAKQIEILKCNVQALTEIVSVQSKNARNTSKSVNPPKTAYQALALIQRGTGVLKVFVENISVE
jgi:hypothetical protein